MSISRATFNELIKTFQFKRLFNELGWDNFSKRKELVIDSSSFALEAVTEKKGFVVFVCTPTNGSNFPAYNIRKKIDHAVTKDHFEHLIIFCDKTHQVWQLIIREHGKPTTTRERHFYSHQEPELLFQTLKGLFFSIDDEDKISIVDVKSILLEQFNANAERVTKKFYEQFKKEHTAFLAFINGISETVDKDWYASLMLNRLMFIYFIQKKGFLDTDRNYLRTKLNATQEKRGKNKFYSFYRNFLLVLFHEGLGSSDRSPELINEIGKVPYLNGGLFDVHHVEKNYKDIQIEDKAFEKIFDFFDQYEWHLDTRIVATGRDINPDVIGYIFEKYINDRAKMGAYYTKEDITEYISKNCIIPFLFDEVKRNYPKGLAPDSAVWRLLHDSGDAYIYAAIKHGISVDIHEAGAKLSKPIELPDTIAVGLDTTKPDLLERRKDWNKSAPSTFALPTETWREVVERRKRYEEITGKIKTKQIVEINDFITYNLNIRQFAQDVIENTEDPELIRYIYKAISSISVLDPTCGSGAFLFAALNVLEPLYEACIQRMESFVKEEAQKGRYKFFEEVLVEANNTKKHPNLQYFIYKSIILRNLYGVDIMKESIEIAKLRLFLKLVATVDVDYKKPNMGLEPLPDIDFNIRSGNTLVGFASLKDVEKAVEGDLLDSTFLKKEIEDIKEQAETIKRAFERFKDSQLITDSPASSGAKQDLEARLKKLDDKLDEYQAQLYGIDVRKKNDLKQWKGSHQPFHWFAEFYEIIHKKGGFDVIIGNPPYVEYQNISHLYSILNFKTRPCGDLYAYVMERSLFLLTSRGKLGMIIPVSIVSTDGFSLLREYLIGKKGNIWNLNFAERPSKLFEGVEKRLSIWIMNQKCEGKIYFSKYKRWLVAERAFLFNKVKYLNEITMNYNNIVNDSIAKIENSIELSALKKVATNKQLGTYFNTRSEHTMLYTRKLRYFIQFYDFIPLIKNSRNKTLEPSELKSICFNSRDKRDIAIAVLNSSLFFWFFTIYSDVRNVNKREIEQFRFSLDTVDSDNCSRLVKLYRKLMCDYQDKSVNITANYKKYGTLTIQSFQPRLSKTIIDDIDKVLAKHYGFTEEELDFIINYDIKYRMGIEEDDE